MKYTLAASLAMAALVGAAPVNNKRDMAYSTTTVDEWVTVWSTTTVWEGEATDAPAATSIGGFFEVKSSSTPSSAPASPTYTSTSVSVSSTSSPYIAPAVVKQSTTSTSTTPTSTSVYVAPTPTSTSVYVAPVVAPTTTAAPTTPTTTAVYVAPVATSTAAAAVPVVASSSTSTTGTETGDMTYYDVSVGLTSCGVTGSNSDFLVAMNKPDMANGVNPNNNPHCGQYINIYYNGVGPVKGKVVDTCPECVSGAIDVTNSLFLAVAPSGDGRVHGVSWSWA